MNPEHLDYPLIQELVTNFYTVATSDVFIGYLFTPIEDFKAHIPRIANFWFAQIYGKFHHAEATSFDLIKTHLPLGFKRAHVRRWVILFLGAMAQMETQYGSIGQIPEWKILKEKVDFFEKIFLKNSQLFPYPQISAHPFHRYRPF